MAEYFFLLLTWVCHTISLLKNILNSGTDFINAIFEYCLVMLGSIFMYTIYKYTKKNNFYLLNNFHLKMNYKYFHAFIFILALSTLFFYLHTGVGRAESYVQVSYSQIFSILNINSIIWIYYCLCREKRANIIFWINIAIFVIYRLLQGWSGIIFQMFFFELYYWLKRHGKEYKRIGVKRTIICITTISLIIVGGGVLYSFVSPIKYMIRYSTPVSEVRFLRWDEGINRLSSRLTYVDSAIKTGIYKDRIIEAYKSQGNDFLEIQSIFRPIVPKSIMPNKEFYNLGSCVYTGLTSLKNYNVSDSNGIINYIYLLFAINPIVGLIWVVFFVGLYCIIRAFFDLFEEKQGQFEILIFYITIGLSATGNIETQFTQTYFKVCFFIPILFLLGICKLYRKID